MWLRFHSKALPLLNWAIITTIPKETLSLSPNTIRVVSLAVQNHYIHDQHINYEMYVPPHQD